MAVQGFKKQQEMLRILLLEGGAYTREQFANKLGISKDNFDKSMAEFETMALETHHSGLVIERGRRGNVFSRFRYDYFRANQDLFALLFRTRMLKTLECERLAFLLNLLHEKNYKISEIAEVFAREGRFSGTEIKSISRNIKELEEMGVVEKLPNLRPIRYRLKEYFFDELSVEELMNLYDYIWYCANTANLCALGYLISDSLRRYLKYSQYNIRNFFYYRHNYFGRMLDEYIVFQILDAIKKSQKINLVYYPKKNGRRYQARPTNSNYIKASKALTLTVIPLYVIYDNQYGRWYLIGKSDKSTLTKFRIENVEQISPKEELISEEALQDYRTMALKLIKEAWVIGGDKSEIVKVRFYNENNKGRFIKERVLQEGQHGNISDERETSFVFEIRLNDVREIKPWIRSFGSSAEVLEPVELREEMAKEWADIKGLYGCD